MCGWYKSRQHAGFLNSCCTCTWYQWRRRCDSNSGCVSFFFVSCLFCLFFTLILKVLSFCCGSHPISHLLSSFTHLQLCITAFSPPEPCLLQTDMSLPAFFEFLVSQFWAPAPLGESSWHSARLSLSLSAGVSGGKVQKLPASWRGRGRAAEGSLRREPPDCLRDHRSKVRHQTWWGKLPWEQRQWQDPREQLGSRVPAQRQGWNGSELRVSPAGLCWRRRPAGC